MFENITKFFKRITKKQNSSSSSKDTAKERLHLVLMQDRANVSADFLDLMRQEIIDVIKKYIEVDESAIDVRLTNKENEDGTNGAPALYANIPIINIKEEAKKEAEKNGAESKNEKIVEDIQKEKTMDDILLSLQSETSNEEIDKTDTQNEIEEKNEQKNIEKEDKDSKDENINTEESNEQENK